jgi:TetR/AcrR family transcriptional regulator, lmrAB and yxaGH operons repressor
MATVKVSDDIVIGQLLTVFRSVGYDGASMAQLAEATGLQKASLYHRFPAGKLAMAKAVLDAIETQSRADIVEVLLQTNSMPANRLKSALTTIDALYDGGQLTCVLRALSLGTEAAAFREQIARIYAGWITGFTQLAIDLGRSETEANYLAQSVLIRVQGVLVLAGTLQQPELFGQVLASVETDFLA